jgi:hypothetical protein
MAIENNSLVLGIYLNYLEIWEELLKFINNIGVDANIPH